MNYVWVNKLNYVLVNNLQSYWDTETIDIGTLKSVFKKDFI